MFARRFADATVLSFSSTAVSGSSISVSFVPAHARHQCRRERQNPEGKENLARTLTYTLLNAQHALLVVLRDEADRDTAAARTRSTADAVRVLLRAGRDVPVDDERDVRDVEPARADVRRDEHGYDARAEQRERGESLALRQT